MRRSVNSPPRKIFARFISAMCESIIGQTAQNARLSYSSPHKAVLPHLGLYKVSVSAFLTSTAQRNECTRNIHPASPSPTQETDPHIGRKRSIQKEIGKQVALAINSNCLELPPKHKVFFLNACSKHFPREGVSSHMSRLIPRFRNVATLISKQFPKLNKTHGTKNMEKVSDVNPRDCCTDSGQRPKSASASVGLSAIVEEIIVLIKVAERQNEELEERHHEQAAVALSMLNILHVHLEFSQTVLDYSCYEERTRCVERSDARPYAILVSSAVENITRLLVAGQHLLPSMTIVLRDSLPQVKRSSLNKHFKGEQVDRLEEVFLAKYADGGVELSQLAQPADERTDNAHTTMHTATPNRV
ncbi:uncharacterized protein BDR25DRAFT_355482 [Lindgomyces ingoldianus]|uniref:Uncharacterized protein n=1 Tax=Lindgomyces ingoldianus TaxID=673940 RepID=A0ACB6QTR0_9PLEO|nr:uncharacterized protein BDR25DRAFT_355482 [Lindgomyces ingoldianus]KAF2470368.1 hypothetical protein BDR25DRAFT_355482 [Lindgomyces ingoldianus]